MSITPKMIKNVITIFNSLEASGPDFVSMMTLKNCKPLFVLASFQHLSNLEEIPYSRLLGSFIC